MSGRQCLGLSLAVTARQSGKGATRRVARACRRLGPCIWLLLLVWGTPLCACAQPMTLAPTVSPMVSTRTHFPKASATPSRTSATRGETSATSTSNATLTSTPTQIPTETPIPSLVPFTPTPVCAETHGRIERGIFFSAVIGRDQPYRVYLPPCYDFGEGRYPVLYMLHGYPFDDAHWDEIGIDEAADSGIADGLLQPFIIAMPAADNEGTYTNTSGGPRSFEGVLMDEFIPFIEATYRALAEPKARAIGGMSRGGVWSLEIAFRHPDRFSAVGGHSAALNVNNAPTLYDPFHLAADPAIRSLRIFLDTGQGDWVLPGMEDLHGALVASSVAHDYRVFEGFHDDSYWSAHVAEYLTFYASDW